MLINFRIFTMIFSSLFGNMEEPLTTTAEQSYQILDELVESLEKSQVFKTVSRPNENLVPLLKELRTLVLDSHAMVFKKDLETGVEISDDNLTLVKSKITNARYFQIRSFLTTLKKNTTLEKPLETSFSEAISDINDAIRIYENPTLKENISLDPTENKMMQTLKKEAFFQDISFSGAQNINANIGKRRSLKSLISNNADRVYSHEDLCELKELKEKISLLSNKITYYLTLKEAEDNLIIIKNKPFLDLLDRLELRP